jgi:hypothetical protein
VAEAVLGVEVAAVVGQILADNSHEAPDGNVADGTPVKGIGGHGLEEVRDEIGEGSREFSLGPLVSEGGEFHAEEAVVRDQVVAIGKKVRVGGCGDRDQVLAIG